jgi:pimeloyl-ACP methyl ester carboxylesterase
MKVPTARMIETREIETAPSLVFDCSVGGNPSAPLVLMLHGFCVSRYFWDNQIPVLAAAGYFAVAPNQRGYAAGARPDPTDFDNYRIDKLIGDANDIVTGVGQAARRFHLVGHAWGGSLAWIIADRWPERIASLTMLSRPHPASFARALKIDLEQPHRSRHHQEWRCQVNLSRSEKPEAGCAIIRPRTHPAIRSPLRPERSAGLIARRDGVQG